VVVRPATAVEGLEVSSDRGWGRVEAARLAGGEVVPCALVVDATGRQARSLAWLEAAGYEAPETSMVEVDTRYVTRTYRRGEVPLRDWKAAAVIDDPATKRLAMVLPVEGGRWLLLFGGLNGESPPVDEVEALAYARSLPSPVIADVMEGSELIAGPVTHRFPANQRRHVERLRRFPLGWVLVGDAICSFDPIYGQGMTSAAMQAAALGMGLERSPAIDRRFTRRYFRAASRVVATPWSIAVGGDFAYPGTTGKKPTGTDLVNRYMNRVTVAAQHDDAVALRLNEVISLVRRPESLMAPRFVAKVLRAARRGPVGEPAATGASSSSARVSG
jgi:2-polyprenyl-6-methoxyphenol hydroxylase-like FAD-dependent oxidoreductase